MKGKFIATLLLTLVPCLGFASAGSAPKPAESLCGEAGREKVWRVVDAGSYQGGEDKDFCKPGDTWTFTAEEVTIACGKGAPTTVGWSQPNSREIRVGDQRWELSYLGNDCEKGRRQIRLTYISPSYEPQSAEKPTYILCPK